MENDPRIAPSRTWEELRDEVQSRADSQVYPLTGMLAEDVQEILSNISSMDRDEWGRAWAAMGQRYFDRGAGLEASDRAAAGEAYIMAWRYFAFGAWPTQNAPEKKKSFEKCVEAFHAYARLQRPTMEIVRIPFEGGEIPVYLQLPEGVRPAPVIITIGGLDSYKEYTAERYGPVYMSRNVGFVAVDAPGTGESPLKAAPDSERIYSAIVDYLLTRDDVDPAQISAQGVSFGGYWVTRFAYSDTDRLKCACNWAGPSNIWFTEGNLLKTFATREYLFDFAPAFFRVFGASDLDDCLAKTAKMSIKALGLVDDPLPPFLLVNGEKDTVAPIEDTHLILRNGTTPRWAWINPAGIHLARSAEWNDERIMDEIIVPWFEMQLAR